MRKTWSRCLVAISAALLLCTISLRLRAQQSETVKTETELIVALVKPNKTPKEISDLLHANSSLVTDNLWETLMAVATNKFYQNSEQAFRLYDLAREVALQLKIRSGWQRRITTSVDVDRDWVITTKLRPPTWRAEKPSKQQPQNEM